MDLDVCRSITTWSTVNGMEWGDRLGRLGRRLDRCSTWPVGKVPSLPRHSLTDSKYLYRASSVALLAVHSSR